MIVMTDDNVDEWNAYLEIGYKRLKCKCWYLCKSELHFNDCDENVDEWNAYLEIGYKRFKCKCWYLCKSELHFKDCDENVDEWNAYLDIYNLNVIINVNANYILMIVMTMLMNEMHI